jgi:hypothetical protein
MEVSKACEAIATHLSTVWNLQAGTFTVGHTEGVQPAVIYLYLTKRDLKRFADAELPDVGFKVDRQAGMPARPASTQGGHLQNKFLARDIRHAIAEEFAAIGITVSGDMDHAMDKAIMKVLE